MKKRILSAVIALAMLLSVIPSFSVPALAAVTPAEPQNGTGTSSDPYQITTEAELEWYRQLTFNTGTSYCALLMNDLTLTQPWGMLSIMGSEVFDGGGHTISNVNVSSNAYTAAFSSMQGSSVLRNVHIKGNILGSGTGTSLTSGALWAGGLVGIMAGSARLENCSFDGHVEGPKYVGGLVGYIANSTAVVIENCRASGTIKYSGSNASSDLPYIGGFVGLALSDFLPDEDTQIHVNYCSSTMVNQTPAVSNAGFVGLIVQYGWIRFDYCYSAGSGFNYAYINTISGSSSAESQRARLVGVQCHSYNPCSSVHRSMTNAAWVITDSFFLDPSVSTPVAFMNTPFMSTYWRSYRINASMYTNPSTYVAADNYIQDEWDFSKTAVDGDRAVWMMGSQYPIFNPYFTASYKDGQRYDYYGSTASTPDNVIDLSTYMYSVNDTNYATSGRFKYTMTNTDPKPVHRTVKSDGSEYEDDGTGDPLVQSIVGDSLTLDPDAPVGDYTINITASDPQGKYEDYSFTINIRKKYKVPAPGILAADQGKTYSPTQTLADISLDPDTWFWEDDTLVPKNTDSMPAVYYVMKQDNAYKAFFRLDKDTSQSYNANVKANYTDYYDWKAVTDYAASTGRTLTVDTADNDRLVISVDPKVVRSTADPMSPEAVHIFVKDADTYALINGATVKCTNSDVSSGNPHYPDEFPRSTAAPYDSDVTANDADYGDGYVYAEMVPDSHTFKISAPGYDDLTQTEVIYATGSGNTLTFYLKALGKPFTLPKVFLRDPAGNTTYQHNNVPVPNAEVTVTRLTGTTNSWTDADGNPLTSISGAPDDIVSLPTGNGTTNIVTYEIRSSSYRCTTDDVLYLKYDSNGDPQLYTDPACTSAASRDYLVADQMTEPVYLVYIDKVDGTDPQEYTVRVDLKNIKATHGTFGLKYDPEIFDVPSTGPAKTVDTSNISSLMLAEDLYAASGLSGKPWKASNGYYEFIWQADGTSAGELDTELTQKTLVTFTFKLKSDVDPNDASVDWFSIMPWGDTEAAQAAVADPYFNDEADIINYERWRVCDTENNPSALGFGRIERAKADVAFYDSTGTLISNEDTAGFFQASVNPNIASTAQANFFDVMTEMHYGFPIQNSIIRFHVYDNDPLEPYPNLDNATVNLFDRTPTLKDTQISNVSGIAKFNINTSTGASGYSFEYDVSRLGYWPVPEGTASRPIVNAPTGKVTNVQVPLEKKIYHKPIMVPTTSGATVVGSADLGGEKYAYNGRDFHFRCKAAKGYKITKYPTKANVYIIDKTGTKVVNLSVANGNTELTPDTMGVFTLDKQYLDQETLKSLSTSDFAALVAGDPYTTLHDYGSPYDPALDPTTDGFRSYNVYIEFDDVEYTELSYRVEGMTNSKGTVTYTNTAPELDDDAFVRTSEYVRVNTTTAASGGTNHQTGTFHFAAVGDNVIEKVYINGLRTYIYDGLTSFDYTFEEVDMDCNITVLYYDGTEADANKDSLVTLVVGEYGTVKTTSPESEEGIFNTRRVYLNKGADLVFEPTPDGNGYYQLHRVEREIEVGGVSAMQDISNTDSSGVYTVSPVQGRNVVVYVTFKHHDPDPDTTPNVFVKSYVNSGTGVVKNAGILIYTMYDTVDIEMKTNAPFSVKEMLLQPFNDLTQTTSTTTYPSSPPITQVTYSYPSLTENIALGAVFDEAAYTLTGNVYLDQYSNIYSSIAVQTGATVRFVRLDGAGNEKPFQTPYVFTTTAARRASFTADIPAGDWNVYIEKPGYVTYKLTKFTMPTAAKVFGANSTTTYPVIPYIGSTTNGKAVTLNDAANIKSGWRSGVNVLVKERADVDDDGLVGIYDIDWVWNNFNRRMVEQDYNNFETSGPVTVAYP